MKKIINNIIAKLTAHRRTQDSAIVETYNQLQRVYDHLIAIARLSLIKPEVLVREVKNVKANGEYLLKMIEAQKELQNDKKE